MEQTDQSIKHIKQHVKSITTCKNNRKLIKLKLTNVINDGIMYIDIEL